MYLRSKNCLFCLKQFSLIIKQILEFSYHLIDWERLLSVVVGGVGFLLGKPLDFHETPFSVSPSPLEV